MPTTCGAVASGQPTNCGQPEPAVSPTTSPRRGRSDSGRSDRPLHRSLNARGPIAFSTRLSSRRGTKALGPLVASAARAVRDTPSGRVPRRSRLALFGFRAPQTEVTGRQDRTATALQRQATSLPSRFARSLHSLAHPPIDSLRSSIEPSFAPLTKTSHGTSRAPREARRRATARADRREMVRLNTSRLPLSFR